MPNRGARAGDLRHSLIQIVDALVALRLPYMLIGAFALSAWGRPRATLDLDFIIQTPEVPDKLVHKLAGMGFHFDKEWDRYNPMIRPFHRRFRSGRIPVDIMIVRDQHDGAAFARRKKKRFDGRYLWFPAAEDLLLQKLKVGRPQDFVDAAGIVARMDESLDRKYLSRWARKLRIEAELAHVWPRGSTG